MSFFATVFPTNLLENDPLSGGTRRNFWGHFATFLSTVASTTTRLQKNMFFDNKSSKSELQSGPQNR